MWWVNKFGSVSGPYSDEQIEKGIRQHMFTKLHKISSDRQSWRRIDQTEFWNPQSSAPEQVEIPVMPSVVRKETAQPILETPTSAHRQSNDSSARSRVGNFDYIGFALAHKTVLLIAGVSVAVFVVVAVGLIAMVVSGSEHKPAVVESAHDNSTPETVVEAPKQQSTAKDFDAIKKKVVLIHTKDGSGTGFLLKMDGKKYVVSNDHVIRSDSEPEMVLVDGTKIGLGDLSIASDRDLARYELKGDYECLELSDTLPNNNDEIWVYGNSLGDDVITSLRGFITGVGSKVLKVNAEFVCGNSGSPILSADGKVVAVAAFLRNGDNGTDWTTKNTSFDDVRRFGIRLNNVNWVKVDKDKYLQACAKLEVMNVYWDFLVPYLICLDVSDEKYKTLKLVHKELDKKEFGRDDAGFHEMLLELSKSYAGQGGSWSKWQTILRDRGALIKRLNEAIDSKELTLENGEKALDEFDRKKNITATWENVKAKHREFNSKRKEALLMAKEFLTSADWQDPLMKHGYSSENKYQSVDWYLDGIQYFLDLNAQQLKDLNKTLKKLEKGGDDDEE